MNDCIDVKVDGWIVGWMKGLVDEWLNGMVDYIGGCLDCGKGERLDRLADKWINKLIGG